MGRRGGGGSEPGTGITYSRILQCVYNVSTRGPSAIMICLAGYFLATVYAATWDLVVDFGLFGFTSRCCLFPRFSYTLVGVLDVSLRSTWLLTYQPDCRAFVGASTFNKECFAFLISSLVPELHLVLCWCCWTAFRLNWSDVKRDLIAISLKQWKPCVRTDRSTFFLKLPSGDRPQDPKDKVSQSTSASGERFGTFTMSTSFAFLQSALQQVEKQQLDSLAGLGALQRQHQEWQESVAELMAVVKSRKSVETVPESEVLRGSERSEMSRTSHISSRSDFNTRYEVHHGEIEEMGSDEQPSGSSENLHERRKFAKVKSTSRLKTVRESALARMPALLAEVIMDQNDSHNKGPVQKSVWAKRQEILARIVDSTLFEYITGLIIFVNMAFIGIETEMALLGRGTGWATEIERAFLAMYTFEIVLRVIAGGFGIFKSAWMLLDLFLVCVGLAALIIIPAVQDSATDWWESLLIVRGLRLLRLARVLRTLRRLQVVWRLVAGLLSAWDTMISTMGLILLWLYVFGCVAAEIIATDSDLRADPYTELILQENFSSVPRATLTLLQFVTLDGIAEVYFPLVVKKPVLMIYFLPLLMFLSIALMNLVTAVLVEHALQQSTQEAESAREKKKDELKAALPALLEVFDSLDTDRSGFLTREEIAGVPLDLIPPKILECASVGTMEELFDMIEGSGDGGGGLSQMDFLDGLLSLLLLDMPIWALRLQKLVLPLHKTTSQISIELQRINQHHESF